MRYFQRIPDNAPFYMNFHVCSLPRCSLPNNKRSILPFICAIVGSLDQRLVLSNLRIVNDLESEEAALISAPTRDFETRDSCLTRLRSFA
jgi:hypothetical protein